MAVPKVNRRFLVSATEEVIAHLYHRHHRGVVELLLPAQGGKPTLEDAANALSIKLKRPIRPEWIDAISEVGVRHYPHETIKKVDAE